MYPSVQQTNMPTMPCDQSGDKVGMISSNIITFGWSMPDGGRFKRYYNTAQSDCQIENGRPRPVTPTCFCHWR